MRPWLARIVFVLTIASAVVSVSTRPLAGQEPTLHWAIIILKVELLPGRPLMTISGPFPDADVCNLSLRIGAQAARQQGIEPAYQGCRNDVTVTVPK
jgi:hypothetical protein